VGTTVTYQITVKNNGPGVASGVKITSSLPTSLQFVSANPAAGSTGDVSVSGQNLVISLGTLAVGASVTFQVVVKVTAGGSLTAPAKVTSTTTDPVLSNNQAVVQATGVLPIVVSRPIVGFVPTLPKLPPVRARLR